MALSVLWHYLRSSKAYLPLGALFSSLHRTLTLVSHCKFRQHRIENALRVTNSYATRINEC